MDAYPYTDSDRTRQGWANGVEYWAENQDDCTIKIWLFEAHEIEVGEEDYPYDDEHLVVILNESDRTTAEIVAARLGDDGQKWETDDGVDFEVLMDQYHCRIIYGQSGSVRNYESGQYETQEVSQSDYISGDPIRYLFDDGSAIVFSGQAWDIEGVKPFSWAG